MSNYSITPANVIDLTDISVSQLLIDTAEAKIENYCGRAWRQVTVTDELYSGDGKKKLYLNWFPLISLTALSIYDTGSDEWEAITISGDDSQVEFQKDIGLIIYEFSFSEGNENIKVSYTHGLSMTNLPSSVMLTIAQVAAYYKSNPTGMLSENIGGISGQYGKVEDILKNVPKRIRVK